MSLIYFVNNTGVINDPLGQTHSSTSFYHYFHLKIILCCDIMREVYGRHV